MRRRAVVVIWCVLCASLWPFSSTPTGAVVNSRPIDRQPPWSDYEALDPSGLERDGPLRDQVGAPRWREYSLRALSPEVDEWLVSRAGQISAAVVVPAARRVYVTDNTTSLRLASVVKAPIMLTLLSQLGPARPELTVEEWGWLEAMITVSDNEAADALWRVIGGADGLNEFLRQAQIRGIEPDPDGFWGVSTATSGSLALLLAQLIDGELLAEPEQTVALDLLTRVEAYDQQWGIRAGLPDDTPAETRIGLKDGWYEDDDGWWVNSIGFVIPADGRPAYTLAVLTNQQPSFEYGLHTIETVASLIHAQFRRELVGASDAGLPPLDQGTDVGLTIP